VVAFAAFTDPAFVLGDFVDDADFDAVDAFFALAVPALADFVGAAARVAGAAFVAAFLQWPSQEPPSCWQGGGCYPARLARSRPGRVTARSVRPHASR
jgi:hypothetical protein